MAHREIFIGALYVILESMQDYHGPQLFGVLGYELACLENVISIHLTEDTIHILGEYASDWCLWCYKDARFMGLLCPAENGGWMKLHDR